jgi:capsular exopolysaccharide synthesis family protein
VSKLSVLPTEPAPGMPAPYEQSSVDHGEIRLHFSGLLWRHRWLILAATILGFTGALLYLRVVPPLYDATASLRVETKEPNPPEMWARNQASTVETDIEVLRSRSLVEDAVRGLKLQLRIRRPRRIAREELFQDIAVAPDIREREYRLSRQPDGSFVVEDADADQVLTHTRPGERLVLPGAAIRLTPGAARYEEIRFRVQSFADAVANVRDRIEADRAEREGDVLTLHYQDSDPEVVWRVPNVIVQRFVERRGETQTTAARSQVKFLRGQIDTLSQELSKAEEELKTYRERAQVVIPSVEAGSQISRLTTMEAERSTLEAERSALAKLVAQVDSQGGRPSTGASPYRLFLAFPPLLRSQTASQLLGSLAAIDDQRSTLLTRRTENDPDVQHLTHRVHELEDQVGSMAHTYLQGLQNQMASVDSSIAHFRRDLQSMPQKELNYTRLERRPTVLKDVYTLLQTRLHEAEIAAAAEKSGVSIVDPAIPPRHPTQPRTVLSLLVGLVGGLLLGISCAVVVEYFDRSVHTRIDVRESSGLPVVGLIPRILGKVSPVALITKPGKRGHSLPLVGIDQVSSPREALVVSTKAGGIAEAYWTLQTNLAFARQDPAVKTVVFTSPLPGDGKTTTVVNLAISLVQRGLRIFLVDADLRRGILHQVLGGSRGPGLWEVLMGRDTLESARRSVPVGTGMLDYLTTGRVIDGMYGVVGSEAMSDLLNWAGHKYDLVIVDTPPINVITDAAILATRADGVVLVARAGVTTAAALSFAVEQLHHIRADMLGVVLNDVNLRRDAAYDSSYKYLRAYEYVASQ